MKKFLIALLAIPVVAMVMAGAKHKEDSAKSAQTLVDHCQHEVTDTWLNFSRRIESLKDATDLQAVTNVFDLAISSTNRLAAVVALIDKDQARLAGITNDINQQPLELVDKQALRGYVESDLQVLQTEKQIASQDLGVISDFVTRERPRWTSMIAVLGRMYTEPETMSIMRNRFSGAADDIRAAIESHRAATPTPVESVAPRPMPVKLALPVERAEPRSAPVAVTYNPPPPAASSDQLAYTVSGYAGLSDAVLHAVSLLDAGFKQNALLDYIKDGGPFRLSSDHIIFLRSHGVPERLIVAMLKRDKALRVAN